MVSSTFNRGPGRRIGGHVRRHLLLPVAAMAGVVGLSAMVSGCLDRELKPLNPCLVSGVVDKINVQNVDKVDLLFVVDNSGSMKEEQQALRVQFPRLIRTLTTGMRPDGTTFPPVRDLHLGVVSTDMGLPMVPQRIDLGCGTDEGSRFGDDGILQNRPNPGMAAGLNCASSYPPFLRFRLTDNPTLNEMNANQIANDFSCIASLGTSGCGFEFQLEAGLKALWPSNGELPGAPPGQVSFPPDGVFAPGGVRPFLDGTPFGKGGPTGPNTGFLRNDPTEGLSLIAVIIVSDEEDCSSHFLEHFVPERVLPPDHQYKNVGLNLRCFDQTRVAGGEDRRDQGAANLYATARYAQGFKALRPDAENLVVFGAIVGVPTELVAPDRLAQVDFSNEAARNGFYDSLLNHPALIEQPDPATLQTNPNLIPSCLRTVTDPDTGMPVAQRAFPPRRFIKVAKEFGENAVIQSICSDDFTPAMDQIITIIARQLGAVCLPRQLNRDSDGNVSCDVVWELPLPGQAPQESPFSCADRPFLSPPPPGRKQLSENNRPLCVVRQVPVVDCAPGSHADCSNGKMPNIQPGTPDAPLNTIGWYYDNFSEAVGSCTGASQQRIAFTNAGNAQPPSGVTVRLECLQEAESLTASRPDVMPSGQVDPAPGGPCPTNPIPSTHVNDPLGSVAGRANACHLRVNPAHCDGRPFRTPVDGLGCYDTQMFCHPQENVCVAACGNKSDCQAGFECDTRDVTTMSAGGPICVNPTCGE